MASSGFTALPLPLSLGDASPTWGEAVEASLLEKGYEDSTQEKCWTYVFGVVASVDMVVWFERMFGVVYVKLGIKKLHQL